MEARIQTLPPRDYPGGVVARIFAIYELSTTDLEETELVIVERVSVALGGLPLQYLELAELNWLTAGRRCRPNDLRCRAPDDPSYALLGPGIGGAIPNAYNGNLGDTDPRMCEPANGQLIPDNPTTVATTPPPPTEFNPMWDESKPLQLDRLVAQIQFCVHKANTSLVWYPLVIDNVFITGWRDKRNANLMPREDAGIQMTLWVVGRIPVMWAKFFNRKFMLNNSIPMPMYQPEVVDPNANFTNVLNFSSKILAVRRVAKPQEDGGDILDYAMPVCQDPKVSGEGCVQVSVDYYFHPMLPEYSLRNIVERRKTNYTVYASDVPYLQGTFNVSQGPWPVVDWVGFEQEQIPGPWSVKTFPQKESVYDPECHQGAECKRIFFAPPLRHLHSAVLYKSWSFQDQAWRYLCNENPKCGSDCLTNLTCLGGASYFSGNFFFRSSQFRDDDGGIVPEYLLTEQSCPNDCCKDRRLCMRVHDVLGYETPFDREYMLVFGGKGYVDEVDPVTGETIYISCEQIDRREFKETWSSCNEVVLGDLWRYDIQLARWDYIKADSALSATTLKPVGYPLPRFGHAAVMVEATEGDDKSFKRYFMYIYGGLGPQCADGGVCNDVWKYEIPFAAQAYYPKFPDGDWVRGNQWFRLKDNPFGGRYRHAMVVTSGMEYIYSYGGQVIGKFDNMLMRYRISTDRWEDVDPFGRVSLTRMMYDFMGQKVIQELPIQLYNSDIDVDCTNAWRFDGIWAHCAVCADCRLKVGTRDKGGQLLEERGDIAMVSFADTRPGSVDDMVAVFGGFRTTWGTLRKDALEDCSGTTTTTTEDTLNMPGGMTLTDAPNTNELVLTTTTFVEQGGVQVIGAWERSGPTIPPTTTTTTYGWTTTGSTTLHMVIETYTSTTTTTGTSTTMTTTQTATTTTGTVTGTTTLYTGTQTFPPVVGGKSEDGIGRMDFNASPYVKVALPSDVEGVKRIGPQACRDNRYYFDDVWLYEATTNQFFLQTVDGGTPMARRGHKMIARRASSSDPQLILFGGHNQDKVMNDMWVLNVMRESGTKERVWARIDQFFEGLRPPTMSYHTMLYSEARNEIIVFGGLNWKETDLARSDVLRNVDRRCFKKAQGLPQLYDGESEANFMSMMMKACRETNFCCLVGHSEAPPAWVNGTRIRSASGALNLTALSLLCSKECDEKAFNAQFYAKMIEGVWIFQSDICPGNCSGHGYCELSQCVCKPEWYGIDCSQRRCPGSTCYTDQLSKEQFCVECSSHGRCIGGECSCFPGWGFNDCSAVMCEANCSSTPTETRGVCVEDFPVHQCVCTGAWSGSRCDQLLCLNACSGHGKCQDGVCKCEKHFAGEDCSVWTFAIP